MRRLTFLFLCLFPCVTGAQDLTAPLLSGSWSATYSNVALIGNTKGRFTVGLPGLSNQLLFENVSYNELFDRRDRSGRILDLTQLVGLLDERNEISDYLDLETIGLAYRGDRLSVSLTHRLRAVGQIDYPRSLVDVATRGNAQFIGETVDVTFFGAATSFHELGLGLSYRSDNDLIFGARVKYLSGIADARTERSGRLVLNTDQDNFALTLGQDFTLNSSGILDYEDLENASFDLDFNRLTGQDFFNGNSGFAVDLGFYADLEGLRLQFAANDLLANINWSNEVTSLRFLGQDEFTGLDVLTDVLRDSIDILGAIDSISLEFEPLETSTPYNGNIGSNLLAGVEVDLSELFAVGFLLRYDRRYVRDQWAGAVSGRYYPTDWLAVGGNLNFQRGAGFGIGAHLYLTPGPVQLLVSTDNLLAVLRGRDSNGTSLRLGAALTFGEVERF